MQNKFKSLLTQLSGNAGISVWWIMWVMTNCFMSDFFFHYWSLP